MIALQAYRQFYYGSPDYRSTDPASHPSGLLPCGSSLQPMHGHLYAAVSDGCGRVALAATYCLPATRDFQHVCTTMQAQNYTSGIVHTAYMPGLEPDTAYDYQVRPCGEHTTVSAAPPLL